MLRRSLRRPAAVRAFATAAVLAGSAIVAIDAFAACTRLAFSVNDYGKVGPTNDAKNMLDKYIAKWAADRKIKGYNTGPKEVTCELFLDVGLFDEYTCKAAATVCWNGALPAGHTTDAGQASPFAGKAAQGATVPAGAAPRAKAAPKAAADGAEPKAPAAPIATGSVKAAPAAAASTPAAPAEATAPSGPPSAARSVVQGAAARQARPAAAPAPRPALVAPEAN